MYCATMPQDDPERRFQTWPFARMVPQNQRRTSAGNPLPRRAALFNKALDFLLHLCTHLLLIAFQPHFRATSPQVTVVVVVFTIGRFTCVKNASVLLLAYLSSINCASRLTTIRVARQRVKLIRLLRVQVAEKMAQHRSYFDRFCSWRDQPYVWHPKTFTMTLSTSTLHAAATTVSRSMSLLARMRLST